MWRKGAGDTGRGMKKIMLISVLFGIGVFAAGILAGESFAMSATAGGISAELAVLVLLALLVKKEKYDG